MKKLFLVLLLFFSSIAFAAENYICESEAAGGVKFNFQQKKYEGMAFKGEDKNVLTFNKAIKIWEWKGFGDNYPKSMGGCKDEENFISCKLLGGEMGFSKLTLRYYETYILPATMSTKNIDKKAREILEGNTPSISVGSCAAIN
jgi:hypothetical protein